MFDQHFGQYLLNNGQLNVKQLRDALEQEQFTKAKLGVLAINAGFMTAEQVDEVHKLQWTIDRKFGEIAISKGYLTEGKVDCLLNEQKNNSLSLSQVIIDKEYMSFHQLETALLDFKKKNDTSVVSYDMSQVLDLVDSGMSEVCIEYTTLFLRNIMRFLNDVPLIDTKLVRSLDPLESVKGWFVNQDITGETNLFTGVVMEDAAFLECACRFSEEDLKTIDRLAQDSVAEFINVHNGIFSVNMSNKGLNFELGAPSTIKGFDCKLSNGWRIPFQVSFGTIELIVGKKEC